MGEMVSPAARALIGYALFGTFWGCWGAVLPGVREHAHVDDGRLGAALLMVAVGALATMRLTGALIDRHAGVVLPVTGALFGASALGPPLATGAVALAVTLGVLGAASGAMDVAITATGVGAEAATGRPLLNLGNAAFSGGVVASSLASGGALAAGASAQSILTVVGVVIVAASIAVLRPGRDDPPAPARDRRDRGRVVSIPLLALGVLAMLSYLVENAWQSWGAVHLRTTLHATAALAAAAPAVFAASAMTGRLAGNALLARVRPQGLVAGGAALAAVGSLGAATAGRAWLALAGIALAGLGTSVCTPTLLGVAGRWSRPGRQGGATSTVVTVAYLGFLIGPALVGGVADAVSLRVALAVVAAVAALLAVATLPAFGLEPATTKAPSDRTGPSTSR